MTFKEFKEKIKEWGEKSNYKPIIESHDETIRVLLEGENPIRMICSIHKLERFIIDFVWIAYKELPENERKDLFEIVMDFSATKIEDRGYEKEIAGGVFKPEEGQQYWYISSVGRVHTASWGKHWFDEIVYDIGNCYPTEQSAMDAIRVLELTQKARESQDGFVPDWNDSIEDKYCVRFDSSGIWAENYYMLNLAPIFGCWEEESVCEKFIDDNRHELIWYFTEYHR